MFIHSIQLTLFFNFQDNLKMNKALLLTLFAAALLTGCGNDGPADTPNNGNDTANSGNDSNQSKPGDPTVAHYVKTIKVQNQMNDGTEAENLSWTVTYSDGADGKTRISSITYDCDGGYRNDEFPYTISFDYSQSGKVLLTREQHGERDQMTAILNAQGYVSTLKEYESEIYFFYDNENRLVKVTDNNTQEKWQHTLEYNNDGMLVKSTSGKAGSYEESFTCSIDSLYPHRYPNNTSIDIMPMCLQMDDDYDFLYMAGLLGKRMPYLPEMIIGDEDDYAVDPDMNHFMTPNETIHRSGSYVDHPFYTFIGNYDMGTDNRPEAIHWTEPFIKSDWSYDIVVGSELIDPRIPEKGYQFEIKNRTDRKTNGNNTHVIKFGY